MLLLIYIYFFGNKKDKNIKWINEKNMAFACDFVNHDMRNEQTVLDECPNRCKYAFNCTHWSWSENNCWLKYGSISKYNAFYTANNSSACGIITCIYIEIETF